MGFLYIYYFDTDTSRRMLQVSDISRTTIKISYYCDSK